MSPMKMTVTILAPLYGEVMSLNMVNDTLISCDSCSRSSRHRPDQRNVIFYLLLNVTFERHPKGHRTGRQPGMKDRERSAKGLYTVVLRRFQ
jgi:hypothetical protein